MQCMIIQSSTEVMVIRKEIYLIVTSMMMIIIQC